MNSSRPSAADGTKVNKFLEDKSLRIVNTKDRGTGEGALHIVVKRTDRPICACCSSRTTSTQPAGRPRQHAADRRRRARLG
jgi:hypothetical protein